MVKVWTCKGMISKPIPPFNGLIGLVLAIGYTTYGVIGTLLLVSILTYTKLGGSYLKLGKTVRYACSFS
jgi:hypothetical protein